MPEALTNDEIQGLVRDAVQDAVTFIEEEISEDRIKAQRYFDGGVDIGEEEGRSKVVATKVRDTVRAIKPSLMRVFLSTDRYVEYTPTGPEDVRFSEQATQFAHYKLNELNGYTLLNSVFHDALIKKNGILKVYWDEYTESQIYDVTNVDDNVFTAIVNEENVDVLEHSQSFTSVVSPIGEEIPVSTHDMKIRHNKSKGKLCIDAVPPEEFFIDRNGKSVSDCLVHGHRTEMRVGDVVAMGFDYDTISNLSGVGVSNTQFDREKSQRARYEHQAEDDSADKSMSLVLITEAYMKVDVEGDGVPELYRFLLGGENYELLDYELWSESPFAVFEVDPEPHTFYGRSIADLIINDQDATTAMIRGVLDNVAMVNNPRTEFVEGQVNVDDLMNNEIGGLVRTRAPGMIRDVTVPFVAGQTLTAVQYMDESIEQKTGVTRASMGLNPDALQSTTRAAVDATVSAAAGQVEVLARNLAEGGMTQLFKLILKLFAENSDQEQMMRLNSEFIPVDPRSWNTSMDVQVNVGLGTGREDERAMTLQQTLQLQREIYQAYGPNNGMVNLTQIRNTIADLQSLGGVRNTDRYFAPMSPEIEQRLLQQQAQRQAQQQQNDPNEAYLEAERMKAMAKIESDKMKIQNQAQTDAVKLRLEAQKMAAEDDRLRDQMNQDLVIEQAKIMGDYGTKVNVAQLQQMQNQPRELQQNLQGA